MSINRKDKKTLRKFTHDLIFYIKKLFYVIFSKRRSMDNLITKNLKQIQNKNFTVRVSNVDPYPYIESIDRLIMKDIVIETSPTDNVEFNEKLEKKVKNIIKNGEQLKSFANKPVDIYYNIDDIKTFLKFTRDIEYNYKHTLSKMEKIIKHQSDNRFNVLLAKAYDVAIYHMKNVLKIIQEHIVSIRLAVVNEINHQVGYIKVAESIQLLSDFQYNEILESVIMESDSKYLNDMMNEFKI